MPAGNSSSLVSTIKFIVMANRSSTYLPEERGKDLSEKKYGKILTILYPLGFMGGMVYCFIALWKRETLILFRNMIIEDHASKVVYNSLKRTWGASIEQEFITSTSMRKGSLINYFRFFPVFRQAYKNAGISHVTEFIRVFRIFNFYLKWKNWFSECPPVAVLLARTNDQKRLALGVVAEEYGIPVYAFTVDRVALRSLAPFAIKSQLCWTARQVTLSRERNIPAVRMPVPLVNGFKLPIPEPDSNEKAVKYGLLLNAKCYPEKVAEWVEKFAEKHGILKLYVRPHPGYAVEKLSGMKYSVVCDWHQPLGEYLDGLDLAFALNTNALIDSLLHGIPVIYIGNLDPGDFDLHHYVEDGITIAYSPDDAFPQAVNTFFASEEFRIKWNPAEFTSDGSEERDLISRIAGSMQ
jgi:hypothetical protein